MVVTHKRVPGRPGVGLGLGVMVGEGIGVEVRVGKLVAVAVGVGSGNSVVHPHNIAAVNPKIKILTNQCFMSACEFKKIFAQFPALQSDSARRKGKPDQPGRYIHPAIESKYQRFASILNQKAPAVSLGWLQ